MENSEKLAVIVWMNPQFHPNSHKRLLETVFSPTSKHPTAFPIEKLKKRIPEAIIATEEDLHTKIFDSSEQKPIILPISIATSALGWVDFHIPTSYSEQP